MISAAPAAAGNIVQGGALPIVSGRVGSWIYNGILGNGEGSAGCTTSGCNPITDLGMTAGGTPFCLYDNYIDSPNGYHQLCLGALATIGGKTGAFISYNAYGGATPESLWVNLNGTNYEIPFSGAGTGNVSGPASSTVGDLVTFNNTSGTLIADSGVTAADLVSGPASSTTGNLAVFADSTGKVLKDGGPLTPSVQPVASQYYVATSGSDSNDCLTLGTACATLQHVINLATQHNMQGSGTTINIGAGSFNGATIGGTPIGSSGATETGATITILGAGSAQTTLSPTNCAGNPHALAVGFGAYVKIGSLKLTTSCANGDDVLSYGPGAVVQLANGDVNFGAATNALVDVVNGAFFLGASNFGFTISGGALYGFRLSTHASAVLSVNATYTILNNPAFTNAFVDAIDLSFFDPGTGSSFTGSATGARYALALDSVIDTEQTTTPLPGSLPGSLQSGSQYYTDAGLVCIGAAPSCPNTTASTGAGTGATYFFQAGSSTLAGNVVMVAGTSAGSSGIVQIGLPSVPAGPIDAGGFCVATLNNTGSQWQNGASVAVKYSQGSQNLALYWSNAGTALINGAAYDITWMCH